MTIYEDEAVDVFGDDFGDSAYRMKDIVFDIMLSGVTSLSGIAMELNRQGHWGKEWRAVDVRRLLANLEQQVSSVFIYRQVAELI